MSEHEDVLAIISDKNQAPFGFAPERAALLVIDVQRYFVHPDHAFGQVFERLSPGVTTGYFRRVRETVVPKYPTPTGGLPRSRVADLLHRDRHANRRREGSPGLAPRLGPAGSGRPGTAGLAPGWRFELASGRRGSPARRRAGARQVLQRATGLHPPRPNASSPRCRPGCRNWPDHRRVCDADRS